MKKLLLILLVPCYLIAQDKPKEPVHLREIPKYNLFIDAGIVLPTGDFESIALSGTHIGLGGSYYMNKNWGVSLKLGHYNNNNSLRSSTDNEFLDSYRQTTMSLGMVYSVTKRRFQLDGFLRGGLSFIDVDNSGEFGANNDIQGPFTGEFTAINNSTDSNATIVEAGLRFNYYFRRSVQLYFSPQYITTLGNPLATQRTIGQDAVGPVEYINMSNLLFSVGIKIAVSPVYSNGELRDDE